MDANKNFGEKLVEYLSGDEPKIHEKELKSWRESSPENANAFDSYEKIWKGTSRLSKAKMFDSTQAWQSLVPHVFENVTARKQIRRLQYALIGIAATLFIVLGFSWYINFFHTSSGDMQASTTKGNRSEIILPDGSLVKLNAGSAIRYHFNRYSKTREVHFQGEALFEVAKNGASFVIHNKDGLNLKVLGTKFNYSDYAEDCEVRISLEEGSVELTNSLGRSVIMSPGQVVGFDKKSQQMQLVKIDCSHSMGWLEDKVYMDNMSLEDVCRRLERRYDVSISFIPTGFAKDIHYSGVIQEETVSAVLNALCELSTIKYQMNGKNIVITKH